MAIVWFVVGIFIEVKRISSIHTKSYRVAGELEPVICIWLRLGENDLLMPLKIMKPAAQFYQFNFNSRVFAPSLTKLKPLNARSLSHKMRQHGALTGPCVRNE